jgi:hypothetical protein
VKRVNHILEPSNESKVAVEADICITLRVGGVTYLEGEFASSGILCLAIALILCIASFCQD